LLKTDLGEIVIELDPEKAPVTVANFIQYVNDHHYDGVIFHRVMKDFMIQSGAFTFDLAMKKNRAPIINESNNGLKNLKGTVAMARTSAPNSATSQFFINHKINEFLDHKEKRPGYAVFGKVVKGMDTVDKIAQVETTRVGYHANMPKDTIRILTARLLDSKTQAPVVVSVKEPESVKAPETIQVK
jgi:cyclophilin family peptidyl-prolyl cis-trans isomerase